MMAPRMLRVAVVRFRVQAHVRREPVCQFPAGERAVSGQYDDEVCQRRALPLGSAQVGRSASSRGDVFDDAACQSDTAALSFRWLGVSREYGDGRVGFRGSGAVVEAAAFAAERMCRCGEDLGGWGERRQRQGSWVGLGHLSGWRGSAAGSATRGLSLWELLTGGRDLLDSKRACSRLRGQRRPGSYCPARGGPSVPVVGQEQG